MRRHLPLVAAALAGMFAGAGLAWLWKSGGSKPAAPAVAPVYANSPGDVAAERPAMAEPPKPGESSPVRLPETPPHPFPGEAGLSGIARYEDGSPCAGLALAVSQPWRGPPVNVGAMTHDERVAHFERQGAPSSAPPVVTGADGRFELQGVAEGEYILLSDDPARVLEPRIARAKAGEEIELVVRRQLFVSFEFELPTGEKLQKAYFMLTSNGQTVAAGYDWKPGKLYRVMPGGCKAKVMGGPHDLFHADHEFEVPAAGLEAPVTILLKGQNALIVRRTNSEPYYPTLGVMVVAADVLKEPLTDRTIHDHLRSWGGDRNNNPYVVKDIKPGRYVVHWLFGSAAILDRAEVEFRGGIQEFEHRLPDLRPADHLTARVLGPDGEPVEGARLDLTVVSGSGQSWPFVDRGGGKYWVRRIPVPNFFYKGQEVARSEYILTAKCKHGLRVVRCPVDITEEVVIRYARMGKLTVLAENILTGKAEFDILVAPSADDIDRLMESGGSEVRRLAARQDFSLVAGPVTLVIAVLREDDTSPRRRVVIRREITLGEGEQQEQIDMGGVRPLVVIVPEGLRFLTMRARGYSEQREVKEGRVEFNAVAAGELSLDATTGSMTVTAPVTGDVYFSPLPFNALVPNFAYNRELLTQAGFAAGDAIRQINGANVAGVAAEVFNLFRGAAENGDVSLRVQRGGQWVDFNVGAATWKQLKDYYFIARRVE